jgi:F-type H+-transporting ATPase subunit beta
MNVGEVIRVIGPVVDVRFPPGQLPELYNAIHILEGDGEDPTRVRLVAEALHHLGDNRVSCIAMSSTDGLVRGMKAVDTGAPITVPTGPETLGRVFNVLGQPIDRKGDPGDGHQGRRPPRPLSEGWQDRALRRGWCRQDGAHHGAHPQHRHGAWRHLGLRRCR